MTDIIAHNDFVAAHRDELQQLAARRDAEVARAEQTRVQALDGYRAVATEADARHAAELEARQLAFAREAADAFAPAVSEWCAEPSRDSTRAVQAAFAALDTEKRRVLGVGLAEELMWAMARIFIARDPSCVARFAVPNNYYVEWTDSGARKANHVLSGILRRGNGDAASQLHALESLERELSAIAAGGQSHDHEPAARFELLASGLPGEKIQAQLLALDKRRFEQRHGTPEAIQVRSQAYDEALAKGVRGPGEIAAFIADRVSNAAKQVVSAIAAVVEPDAAAKSKRKPPAAAAELRAQQAEAQAAFTRQLEAMQ